MAKELTLRDVSRVLKNAGCTAQLSCSSGQYHVYVHRGDELVGYERGDDVEEAFERAILPISVVLPNPAPGSSPSERSAAQ